MRRRLRIPATAAVASAFCLAGLAALAGPAAAHTTDPRLIAVIDHVPADLPAGVRVGVVPGVATELVVANRSRASLVVIGADGDPLLRIGGRGVAGNFASPDWFIDNDPEGAAVPPADVRVGLHPRWVVVSRGHSFGFYDPRLYPMQALPPSVLSRKTATYAGAWHVTLRMGRGRYTVAGHIEFRPVLGSYVVAVTDAPPGVRADALQGRLPGLFVSTSGHRIVVVGRDGRPFLRLYRRDISANTDNPSYVADRQARGLPLQRHRGWARLGSGSGVSWLDARLGVPATAPADAARPQVIRRWRINLVVDGQPSALRGTITWQPAAALSSGAPTSSGGSRTWAWLTVLGVALAATGAAAYAVARHRSARSPLQRTSSRPREIPTSPVEQEEPSPASGGSA